MNKRIRELLEQVVRVDVDPDSKCETIYTAGPDEFEAFAELIIQECLDFVEPHPGSGDSWDLALENARDSIKEHFGVTE